MRETDLAFKLLRQRRHFGTDEYGKIHVGCTNRLSKGSVEGIALLPQFLHGAKHGKPPFAIFPPELLQRHGHGERISVVAFINYQSLAIGKGHLRARTPAGKARQLGQRQSRLRKTAAHRLPCRQYKSEERRVGKEGYSKC